MDATASEAHPETMDFLSRAWCNFVVQALRLEKLQDQAIILRDISAKELINHMQKDTPKMEKSMKMEDQNGKSMPQWQTNDLKSWIWMQQAMHPELNYNGCFRKKWPFSWKMPSFKNTSIKKWMKGMKEKRKQERRLERAEVHAAVSIAGLAAALAAVAAGKSKGGHHHQDESREVAVASAAALVAAQCARMAESIGAKRDQLSTIIESATSGTSTSDILTLTAAATTSLRGAATLKARTGCINRLNAPVLPLEDADDVDFDFENNRAQLAKGARLRMETSDGRCMVRVVSLHLNDQVKIILKIKKLNIISVSTSKTECLVLDQHVELYRHTGEDENDTCYQLVLTTNRGFIKLDVEDDYQRCKISASTINHMLMLSSSHTKYELQLCKY